MEEEVLSSQSSPARARAGGRLLRSLVIGILVLVGMSLAWVCAGVTRWGPYTLIGPGYGGIVETRDGRVWVRPGWRRFVDADGGNSRLTVQLSDKSPRFLVITPEPEVSGQRRRLRLMRLQHHFGWIVVVAVPPAPWIEPGKPRYGVAQLP